MFMYFSLERNSTNIIWLCSNCTIHNRLVLSVEPSHSTSWTNTLPTARYTPRTHRGAQRSTSSFSLNMETSTKHKWHCSWVSSCVDFVLAWFCSREIISYEGRSGNSLRSVRTLAPDSHINHGISCLRYVWEVALAIFLGRERALKWRGYITPLVGRVANTASFNRYDAIEHSHSL